MSQTPTENLNVVSQWRTQADNDNPAGPLFLSGEFAEADITHESRPTTLGGCGTACTGSHTRYCC